MRTIVTTSLLVIRAFGQEFDAASIKPNNSGSGTSNTRVSNGEVIMRNIPLRDCIEMAYHVNDARISGPDWLVSERFDIIAKPPAGSSHDQYHVMMQALLADRFKLTVHRESKLMPAFALVVAKGGHKLEPGADGGAQVNGGNAHIQAKGMSMVELADNLSGVVDRPVVDKTGLEGPYDLSLEWTPEEKLAEGAQAASKPSIFTAIQEQLGLRLEAQRLPVDVVVVDHIERVPTEN